MNFNIIVLDPVNFHKCGNIWNMERQATLANQFYNELVAGNRITYVYQAGDEYLGEISLVFEMNDPDYTIAGKRIYISQLKFLYPLKTLVFPAFSPPRFGPFPSFFPLREEMRETFFRPSLQPYPVALRKFAWPLWWRGRKCSSWYLHQNVPAAPAHPWVLPREREGWSYMYASTDGSENHPYPRSSFGSIGTHC